MKKEKSNNKKKNPWQKKGYNKRIRRILKRDGHYCWLCRKKFKPGIGPNSPNAPSIDHVIERRNGGWDSQDNLKLAHRRCNGARKDKFAHTNSNYDRLDYLSKETSIGKELWE